MKRRPRGSGEVISDGAGWAIRYGPRKTRQYESGFRTKSEAERRLTLLRAEAMQRRLGVAADPKLAPTLGALAEKWLERRKLTHAAGLEDGSRWRKHVAPHFGHLRPAEVDAGRLRAFVELKVTEIEPATVRVVIAVLSSLYEDLLERGVATVNPCRHLPKSILRLMRSRHNPEDTPFIFRLDDVRRAFLALPEPINVAFAIGVFAGLRTREILMLEWSSVDLPGRRIVVRKGGSRGGTKDRETRAVPIPDPLLPVLEAWRLAHPGDGVVIPPMRRDGERLDRKTLGPPVRKVLHDCGLHDVANHRKAFYSATRHTFASHWAMAGGSMPELQRIMGHSSLDITMRYAHLSPGFFSPGARQLFDVVLTKPAGTVAQFNPAQSTTIHATPRSK